MLAIDHSNICIETIQNKFITILSNNINYHHKRLTDQIIYIKSLEYDIK